jgi:hypothetical protein
MKHADHAKRKIRKAEKVGKPVKSKQLLRKGEKVGRKSGGFRDHP